MALRVLNAQCISTQDHKTNPEPAHYVRVFYCLEGDAMMTGVCVVLVMLLVACWQAAREKDDAYQKEWRAHLETHRELAKLQVEVERLRIKHQDWD